jgi:small subunit ribosomal protein S5
MSRPTDQHNREESEFIEKLLCVNRVAKVVKGGRRFSFSAVVAIGDGKGQVGVGHGKANEVPEAIRKATEKARRSMLTVPMVNRTVPHLVIGHYGSGQVLLRPASPGTGVIAGPVVRAILDAAGVKDALSKCMGSTNAHNISKAVVDALQKLESPEQYAVRLGTTLEKVLDNYGIRDLVAGSSVGPQE